QVWGPFKLQGVVMFGLYCAGIASALVVALVLKLTAFRGSKPPLLLELPTYKVPRPRNVFIGLMERSKLFLKRAGTLIFAVSICLWFLASYPKPPEGAEGPAIRHSFAGQVGHALAPLVRPVGFTWEIATGL